MGRDARRTPLGKRLDVVQHRAPGVASALLAASWQRWVVPCGAARCGAEKSPIAGYPISPWRGRLGALMLALHGRVAR
jgi:hypothetical protein